MTKLETRLTVLYDEPFWIGLSERVENGKLTVAKHVFGAEPSMADIYEFVLNHSYEQKYGDLKITKTLDKTKAPGLTDDTPLARAVSAAGQSIRLNAS